MTSRPTNRPLPLTAAAGVVAIEGAVLFVYAVLELLHLSTSRVTMGVTTALFFLAIGASLLLCAWGLSQVQSWSRSPVVLAQLIQLGLAWSFRGGDTTVVAVVLAVVSVVVLVGIFSPSSTEALSDA